MELRRGSKFKNYKTLIIVNIILISLFAQSIANNKGSDNNITIRNPNNNVTSTSSNTINLFISWLGELLPFPSSIQALILNQNIDNDFGFGEHLSSQQSNKIQIATLPLNHSNIIRFITTSKTTTEDEYINFEPVFLICILNSSSQNLTNEFTEIQFLLAQSKKLHLQSFYFILFFNQDSSTLNISKLTKLLEKYINLNTNLYVFQSFNSNNYTMEFLELYAIKKIGMTQIKMFSNRTLLNILSTSAGRKNFKGLPLRGVAEKFPGLEWSADIEVNRTTGLVEFKSGYNVYEFGYLRDALNFTPINVKGTGFIRAFNDGTVEGMGFQLENDEADIALTSSEMTILRLEHVRFLHSTLTESLILYFKQLPRSVTRSLYVEAFSISIWLGIFAAMIILTLSIKIISNIRTKLDIALGYDRTFRNESYLWSFGLFCQQGWHYSPEGIPLKIIMISGLLLSCILYTAYSASLVARLSTVDSPIKSLDDAIKHGFTIYNENHTISARYVLTEYQNAGKIRQSTENNETYEIGAVAALHKILNSDSAFITSHLMFVPQLFSVRNLNISDRMLCNELTYVALTERASQSSMFVAKDSEFREHFNYVIIRMIETGIRHRLFNQYVHKEPLRCMSLLDMDVWLGDPIDIRDVKSPLILLLVAHFICLFIVVSEILLVRYVKE